MTSPNYTQFRNTLASLMPILQEIDSHPHFIAWCPQMNGFQVDPHLLLSFRGLAEIVSGEPGNRYPEAHYQGIRIYTVVDERIGLSGYEPLRRNVKTMNQMVAMAQILILLNSTFGLIGIDPRKCRVHIGKEGFMAMVEETKAEVVSIESASAVYGYRHETLIDGIIYYYYSN